MNTNAAEGPMLLLVWGPSLLSPTLTHSTPAASKMVEKT